MLIVVCTDEDMVHTLEDITDLSSNLKTSTIDDDKLEEDKQYCDFTITNKSNGHNMWQLLQLQHARYSYVI